MKPKTKKLLMISGLALGGLTIFLLARKQKASATLVASTATAPVSSSTSSGSTTPAAQPARVSQWPEGTLLRYGTNEKVYIIDAQGYRHWIRTRTYFDSAGYKMSDVKSITLDQMIAIPESTPLGGLSGLGNALLN